MNAENFAEWYHRQGHHVIQTANSYWFNAGPRVYQAFPFGWLIKPSEKEMHEMMLKHGILSMRYSTSLDSSIGKVSYHVTISNPYTLEMLRSQARNAVRRGLDKCIIETVPFECIAVEGWKLQQDTLDRQGRLSSMTESDWRRICLSAVGLEGFEAWAATVDGQLAASLITCRIDDTVYVPFACSHRKFLDMYVNNALFYSVTTNFLARDGVHGIFFSVQSLDAPKSVDDFKFRMGFTAKAVRQRVVFNPLLEPFITNLTQKGVIALSKYFPKKASLAKVEGMVSFYLQGKLPLEHQDWPECLHHIKDYESGLQQRGSQLR